MGSPTIQRTAGILVLLFALLVQPLSAGEQGPAAWRVRDIASAPGEFVQLRGPRNNIAGTVQTKQMLLIYAAMTAMEKAAEVNAELFIVEGKEPNAFATVGKEDQKIVGITFGMLALVGTDVDAIAAILGHELAHLKLHHIEQAKQAMKNTRTTTFSAAATKYTRDNERQADYLGTIWAIEAGYDPNGAVRIQEKLYKLSKRHGGFSASHPSSIERITILKSLVRRLST